MSRSLFIIIYFMLFTASIIHEIFQVVYLFIWNAGEI